MANKAKSPRAKARKARNPIVWLAMGAVGVVGAVWGLANTPLLHPQHLDALRKEHAALFARAEVVALPSVPVTLKLGGDEKTSSINGYFHYGNIAAEAGDSGAPAPAVRWAVPQGRPWPDVLGASRRGNALRPTPPLICELTFPPEGRGAVRRFSIHADVSYPQWTAMGKSEVVRRRISEQHTVYLPTDPVEVAAVAEYERHVAAQEHYRKAGNWGAGGGLMSLLLAWGGISKYVEGRRPRRAAAKK